jgi:hypothetical protein
MSKLVLVFALAMVLAFSFGCKPKTEAPLEETVDSALLQQQAQQADTSPLPAYPNSKIIEDMTQKSMEIEAQAQAQSGNQRPQLEIAVYGTEDSFETIEKYYIDLFGITPVVLDGTTQPPTGDRVAIKQTVPVKEHARIIANLGVPVNMEDPEFVGDITITAFMFKDAGHLIIYDKYVSNITGKLVNAPLIQRILITQPAVAPTEAPAEEAPAEPETK